MRITRTHFYSLILIPSFFISISCAKKEDILTPKSRGELIEAQLAGALTKDEVIERVTELSAQDFALYDVIYYVITYRTEYRGKPIDSRGLLILPHVLDSVRLIMYCHGTEIPSQALGINERTASTYNGSKETHLDVRNMGLGWASSGYAVFFPDYIGYGITLGKDHPYLYYPEMFKSNIDGLLAVKEFLNEKGLLYDNRLFIAGWSQGAGAAISSHKYIQEQYLNEFTVVASSGLAGPYNFERMALEVLNKKSEETGIMPILSWAIYSLNKFSSIQRPADQIFTFPVYDQISSIFTPSQKPEEVFKRYFLAKIADGQDVTFRKEFQNNSFCAGWKPVGKIFLHHGDADNVVPYFNSTDALSGLTVAGGDILLYTYPGGDHISELGSFIRNTLNDFNTLK